MGKLTGQISFIAALLAFPLCGYCLDEECSIEECSNCNPCDFTVSGSLIVWTAREAGADTWAEAIVMTDTSITDELRAVDFGWDPGFRVRVGYGARYEGWNTDLAYTWFRTCGDDQVSRGPGTIRSTFLGNFYINNPFGFGISGPGYESASIDWKIHYNVLDWQLGCRFSVCQSLYLRPFIGAKGGWIDQEIDSRWFNPLINFPFEFYPVGTEKIKNDFRGVGPSVGIETQWILFCCGNHSFNLIGDFSGALMWGRWSFSDEFSNDLPQFVTVDSQTINSGASMVRALVGFEWIIDFGGGCNRFFTKLGYEAQFWFDQLQFYSFTGGRLDNALTLQGGTFEFGLDF